MSGTIKTHQELTVELELSAVRNVILKKLQAFEGKNIREENNTIECDFGDLLKSRLLGEFWVPGSTLPKKAVIILHGNNESSTTINLDVHDTHRYGLMWGYQKKYQQAIDEVANAILSAVK